MRNILHKSCTENSKTHFMLDIFLSRNSCRLWDNVEKYCTAGQTTDDNLAHALCMMYSYGHKHPHRICHTNCFSTATTVERTRLIVTLCVHCLSCWDTCHHAVLFVTKISRVCSAQRGLDVVKLQWKTYTTGPVKSPEPSIPEITDLVLKQEDSPFIILVDVIQTLISPNECSSDDAT
jgi:hypothetical protein